MSGAPVADIRQGLRTGCLCEQPALQQALQAVFGADDEPVAQMLARARYAKSWSAPAAVAMAQWEIASATSSGCTTRVFQKSGSCQAASG